jgi:hypothetical protein
MTTPGSVVDEEINRLKDRIGGGDHVPSSQLPPEWTDQDRPRHGQTAIDDQALARDVASTG